MHECRYLEEGTDLHDSIGVLRQLDDALEGHRGTLLALLGTPELLLVVRTAHGRAVERDLGVRRHERNASNASVNADCEVAVMTSWRCCCTQELRVRMTGPGGIVVSSWLSWYGSGVGG